MFLKVASILTTPVMSYISIPEQAKLGFSAIAELDDNQIKSITQYLSSSIDFKSEHLHKHINGLINSDDKSVAIIRTIHSFSELLEPKDVDAQQLAARLTASFVNQYANDFPQEKQDALSKNLNVIFSEARNLRVRFKALDLLYQEDKLFSSSNIITDVRLVFNDDIEQKDRNGLIVHHLTIVYRKDGKSNSITLALDTSDLKSMHGKIERALNKEELIRSDYHSLINFLNFSNDENSEEI